MAWQRRAVAMLVVVATMGGMAMINLASAQGQASIPSTPAPKAAAGSETNIIPSVTLSERYDSNVFFVPGGNLEDYVTTVSPQLRVVHMGQLVEGTVGGGLTAEAYVKNPGLNYVGVNGVINLNLDRAMNELVRGLGLQISDTFRYTPQPPAFAAPTDGGEISESSLIGIQAQRANSSANAGTVAASYAVSPLLRFTSTYKDQRIQFGSPVSTPTGGIQGRLIDTTFQTVTSGPVLKVSPMDTLTLSHQYQKGTFDFQGSSGFSTQGAIAGWTRLVAPTLTASMTGGVVVFSTTNNLQYVGSASLLWEGQDTDLRLSYTRMIRPSFFIAAVPLLSQVVAATATHHVTESFSVLLNGNYAINQSIPDSSLLKFESYSVTPSVLYKVNRVMTATLSYTHSVFDRTSSSQEFSFDRNIVMLRIFAEWK
jgi:hypothetical protein